MNKVTGLRRIVNATRYSAEGLAACLRSEAAFRQEALLALFMLPLGLWLGESAVEKVLLAGSLLIVMIVEILNSAIERVVDRISDERHQLSKEAKDMGSAAVFVALVLVGLVWGVILLS